MKYVLNPAAAWAKIGSGRYALSVGTKLYEGAGESAEFFFKTFLPFFSQPRSRGEVIQNFASPFNRLEGVDSALSSGTLTSALLLLPTRSEPTLHDVLRTGLVIDGSPPQPVADGQILLLGGDADSALLQA